MKPFRLGIVGYPSRLGGADTELDHQMRLWATMGVQMHVVHTGQLDANLKALKLHERPNVTVHEPRDWKALNGMPVISFCNGGFLDALPEIRRHASAVIWVNCMSWLFDMEKIRHKEGLIDVFIYQTRRAQMLMEPTLLDLNPKYLAMLVTPYFDTSEFPFIPDKPLDRFRFCKISRADPGKYHQANRWVFETMVAPQLKEGHLLGWCAERMPAAAGGLMPYWITCEPPGARPVQEIYAKSHALIHFAAANQTENLPRVGFEAMASGTVVVADSRGGWVNQVQHGKTGWLAGDAKEFVYYASRLAYEPEERLAMAHAARQRLEDLWGLEIAARSWQSVFDLFH